MEWKMFLRTNGRWSMMHMCDEENVCACGFKYEPQKYTEIKTGEPTTAIICCGVCRVVEMLKKDEYGRYEKVLFDELTPISHDPKGIDFDCFRVNCNVDDLIKIRHSAIEVKLKETLVNSISKIMPGCNENNLLDYLKNVQRVSSKDYPGSDHYYYMTSEDEKILLLETENKIEQIENGYAYKFYIKLK